MTNAETILMRSVAVCTLQVTFIKTPDTAHRSVP